MHALVSWPHLRRLPLPAAAVAVLWGVAGCQVPRYAVSCVNACGDGTTETCEECDDGNNADGDGCDAECRREPRLLDLAAGVDGVGGHRGGGRRGCHRCQSPSGL